ncbi:MAG: protoporphyrinogen oxidase, partial [Pseudomonadota bacterium]
MQAKPFSIVIVGGGISGLATALAILDIAKQRNIPPPQVQVLESETNVGGKIRTIQAEGFTCEWGVNGFLDKEPKTFELCRRIGIDNQLLPASAAFKNRYIYARGKLHLVEMNPFKFMMSGFLPFAGKMRLMFEPFVRAPSTKVDESVADFARRRIGNTAFRLLIDPMQTGIYAGDPERMSVTSCFPRVVEVEQQYGSLIKGMVKLARKRKG